MNKNAKSNRSGLPQNALLDYDSGPDAPVRATNRALAKVGKSRAVILVEGISDQIVLETLALRYGRDLAAEGVLILPIGGAQAITHYLLQFGPRGADMKLAGLYDASEEPIFQRGLKKAGLGAPQTRADIEQLGFFACVDDLESELLRAVGSDSVERLFDSQGDLTSFRTLQKQSAWSGRKLEAQMHRFLRSRARRNRHYLQFFVDMVKLERVPNPLDAVLKHI